MLKQNIYHVLVLVLIYLISFIFLILIAYIFLTFLFFDSSLFLNEHILIFHPFLLIFDLTILTLYFLLIYLKY